MFKNLPITTLDTNTGNSFYKLEDLHSYLSGNEWGDIYSSLRSKDQYRYYHSTLESLKQGLPSKKHKIFSDFNLGKLYRTDILDKKHATPTDFFNSAQRFEWLATHKEKLVFCDSEAITTNDIYDVNSKVRLYTDLNKNYRYDKYTTYLEKNRGFGDITVASTVSPNIVTINKNNSTVTSFEYCNSADEPILESNTNIVDIKSNSNVNIEEIVRLQGAQLNYVVYILREDSVLNLDRVTYPRSGCWNIFDSVFICYPGSKLNINIKSSGSHYSAENFYIDATENVQVNITGRNKISKGNDYHSEVFFESVSENNSCDIDIRTVGDEHTNTSFVGTFKVSPDSTGFKGDMTNKNMMLDSTSIMKSRPQLDIQTKEIECAHGCTISNVDESSLYYLQCKGLSRERAKQLLVESFLC